MMSGIRARFAGGRSVAGIAAVGILAVAATGCGSASGSSGGAAQAAAVVKAGQKALKGANAVGFDVKATVNLQGSLQGVNSAQGALLNGPLTLELKGHAQKTGSTGVFDTTFSLGSGALAVNGEIMSPNGKTVYIRVPMILGPGWQSMPIQSSRHAIDMKDGKNAVKRFQLRQFDPVNLLKNIAVTSESGTNTVSADLNVAGVIQDIVKLSHGQMTTAQLRQFGNAIQVAHGSVSYDSSSHLPSAAHLEIAVQVPAKFQKASKGLTGADVKIDASFDDWNQAVHVTAPSSSKPLDLSHIQGLGLS
jgi:hypothetical protein